MTRCLLAAGAAICAGWLGSAMPVLTQQAADDASPHGLTISTTTTSRFVGVHGRRSVIMGYPQEGLEMWAYPLQILSGYEVGFQPGGATSEMDGRSLLKRLVYAPDSVTRIYAGPDYVVRETLFVPLDQPAAIIQYEVESAHAVDIVIHFSPVWNLMWPGAFGGQSTEWHAPSSGYVLAEYSHQLSAIVGSLDTVAHDSTANSTLNTGREFSFTVHPRTHAGGAAVATVVAAQQEFETRNASTTIATLTAELPRLQKQAAAHYAELQNHALRVLTPEADVNSAIAWAQVALDQAWVCNPQLGCGLVAGYGPSRAGRRPQYDWFFGGDGLVATNALVSASDFSRAREELTFIIQYQDPHSGMVWHELSQSAGYIDWSKYPYMFVHVDITFDYLAAVAHYVEASGDVEFAKEHWQSIANAYAYCHSIVRASDHLPHIPEGKEGGDEQNRPDDDLGLSASWVTAARSFAQLARATDHSGQAGDAESESRLAKTAIAEHYWDAKENFWLDGHTVAGAPIFTRRSGFGAAIEEHAFSPAHENTLLDEIASSRFQIDWGARGATADMPGYTPWGYTAGSTSALQSSSAATLFWQQDRPQVAESIWRGILPLNTLDAPGHLHEVLAGNLYLAGTESVPEQTWSSAGFLEATMQGLFGISVHGADNSLVFRPSLPADWPNVTIENFAMPHSRLRMTVHQQLNRMELDISNDGAAVPVSFEPAIPLGARLVGAACNGSKVAGQAGGQHAQLKFTAHPGMNHCELTSDGGVSLILPHPAPEIGNSSTGMKLVHLDLEGRNVRMDADVISSLTNSFELLTPWKLAQVNGGTCRLLSPHLYELQFDKGVSAAYVRKHMEVDFANR